MADPQEFDQYITPDGDTYALTLRGSQNRLLSSGEDIQNGLLGYGSVKGPLQDGDTVTWLRLDARTVQMTISNQECSREEYWDRRATLLDRFRPNRWIAGPYTRPEPGTLRRLLPDGDYRDLLVFLQSFEFTGAAPDQGPAPKWPLTAQVVWRAADPLWYGPTVSGSLALLGVGGLRFPVGFMPPYAIWPLPSVNVWIFGGGYAAAAFQLTNLGTWHTFPVITIAGPLDFATVANITTGESITFNGAIGPGLTLTLDLTYGQKRAYDSAGTDYSGFLDGDVGEFHIACDPEAPGGVNQIQITITGGGAGSLVTVSFRSPYVGI